MNDIINIRLTDIIDILLVAFLLYELYNLVKGTAAINIFFGIISVFLVWKLVSALHMAMLNEILGAFISVGFIALIVVFQPEIRQFLLMIGTPRFVQKTKSRLRFLRFSDSHIENLHVDPVVAACRKMASSKTGAIIIIARINELQQIADTGQILDARISDELLMNIFFKNNPLHDGAVIILNNRILAARCILPVSSNNKIPVRLGLRHRAAIGITEKTDSVAVIVSEETGEISYSIKGNLTHNVLPSQLKNFLETEFN